MKPKTALAKLKPVLKATYFTSKVIIEICKTQAVDNFSFEWDRAEILEQPHMEYMGY